MPNAAPVLVVILAALAGAGLLAFFAARSGMRSAQKLGLTAMAGAAAGAIGSLIFMVPLNFCTFEPEREQVDYLFGIGLFIVGVAITLVLARWILLHVFSGEPLFVTHTQPGTFQGGGWTALLLLAPTLIILLLFLYYPVFDTFSLSTLLARLGARRTAFVCTENFTELLVDPQYHFVVLNTIVISAAIVIIGLALSLFIATMAYQPLKGASLYRTLLIWPYAISPVVAGVIFLILFDNFGVINHFVQAVFGVRIEWLRDPSAARAAVIIASVWKSMGSNILFYIAGLQNIPGDLKEAASIDGANSIQRFFHVVFPLLSPITFFLVITNTTYAFFDTFGTIDYLTRGGPLGATTTMMYQIYQTGFSQNNDLGSAAAQSIILFLMVIGLTALQFRGASGRVTYGA